MPDTIREQVMRLHAEGLTQKEIGARIGLSRQRVNQIVNERARREWWDALKAQHPPAR